MNKKRRVAQMKSHRRKENLKERAKAARPAAARTAVLPARTRYELEETPAAAPVKATKLKAAAPKKVETAKPEVKETAAEVKQKAAAKHVVKETAIEAKPKAAVKPKAAAPKVEGVKAEAETVTAEVKPKAAQPKTTAPATEAKPKTKSAAAKTPDAE